MFHESKSNQSFRNYFCENICSFDDCIELLLAMREEELEKNDIDVEVIAARAKDYIAQGFFCAG